MREGGGIPVDCAQSNFSSFLLLALPIDNVWMILPARRNFQIQQNLDLAISATHACLKPCMIMLILH